MVRVLPEAGLMIQWAVLKKEMKTVEGNSEKTLSASQITALSRILDRAIVLRGAKGQNRGVVAATSVKFRLNLV